MGAGTGLLIMGAAFFTAGRWVSHRQPDYRPQAEQGEADSSPLLRESSA